MHTANWENLKVGLSQPSFDYKLLETTISPALSQHTRDLARYDYQNSSSVLNLVFTRGDDVIQMTILPPIERSDLAVMLFKFTVNIVCQAVVPVSPNIWKADIKVINSAASTENGEIDSSESVGEAWTHSSYTVK